MLEAAKGVSEAGEARGRRALGKSANCKLAQVTATVRGLDSRINESLIVTLCLVISKILLPHLLLEVGLLDEGIVQLGVGVAELASGDETLETFTQSLARAVTLGERRHDLRVADDEGRRDALVLNELPNELQDRRRGEHPNEKIASECKSTHFVQETSVGAGLSAIDVVLSQRDCQR